ncbi:MAG: hypothetical protein H6R01_1072 [Burkholderiaceae bacterium]|nr:hypothetical protein [Burkholderiaceae bacterium]
MITYSPAEISAVQPDFQSSNAEKKHWPDFLAALHQEVVPALGCTEPISLALASAIATYHLGVMPEMIEAKVSANLMKNGMGVTVPGTGMVGLSIAAAVGALGGDPEAGLEVLNGLTPATVDAAKRMLKDGRVSVAVSREDVPVLYAESRVSHGTDWVRVCIANAHTNVIQIEKNGSTLYQATESLENVETKGFSFDNVTARDVYDFATSCPIPDISFMLEAGKLNSALSHLGLDSNWGLHIGATLVRQIANGLLSDDLHTRVLIRTTSASDARMGGAAIPAMSNSGSGNQGIVATMPVVVIAEHLKADNEALARALTLSHLMAIYIHSKLPKLSALCAVTTAAMGAAAGMAYLLGGQYRAVAMAICSMIGDVSGVICDGASNSCAMKVSTSAASAYKSVLMALENSRVTGQEGIVEESVDASIANLCALASKSMVYTDHQILEIMVTKEC